MSKNKTEPKTNTNPNKGSINPSYDKTPVYTKSLASLVASATPKVNDFKEDYKKPEPTVKVRLKYARNSSIMIITKK
jgi:hypothetical protein